MKNNFLIKIIIPEINENFDLFIPVNEQVWKVKKSIIKAVCELRNDILEPNFKYALFNKETGELYNENDVIIRTDIRNVTELVLLSEHNMKE